jgi:hypothetical protein
MTYRLRGSILEVCTWQVLCPRWIGEDPDNGIWIQQSRIVLLREAATASMCRGSPWPSGCTFRGTSRRGTGA